MAKTKKRKTDKNFFIRAAITQDKITSRVDKGENAGLTLAHNGVVRVFYSADLKSPSAQMKIPLKKFVPDANSKLIVFVQNKQSMKILAAEGRSF